MKLRLLKLVAASTLIWSSAAFAADGGAITGTITLGGAAPATKNIPADTDAKCKAAHPKGVPIRNYIVGAKGELANVFVYVKGAPAKPAPATPVVLDQEGCLYNPMVFGIQVGQTLVIQNSDDTSHNIHSTSQKNGEFNFLQASKGAKNEQKFTKPEVFVKFKCDVHSWMSAFAGVVDNPYFAVTKEDGAFKIEGLPAGEYSVVAVHPKAGEQTVKVKVEAGKEAKADFKPFAVK